MTSFYRQQRLSAFVAGASLAAGLYVYTKKNLLHVMEEAAEQLPGGVPPATVVVEEVPEPMLGATARAWAVWQWNEGVDAVFKPVVQALSRRNL